MEQKPRYFIYDRKEMMVLVLLGIAVALFSFTLGIHLGKKVSPPSQQHVESQAPTHLQTAPDPNAVNSEVTDQGKKLLENVDETLTQTLKEEVEKEKVQLTKPIQTSLPKTAKSEKAAAPFTLQVGSYPDEEEAGRVSIALEARGLKTFVKKIDLKDKGRRYRLFVGEFVSKEAAEKAGQEFRSKNWIQAYVVAKNPE